MTNQKGWERYFAAINRIVAKIQESQGAAIEQAAEIMADCIQQDGLIHLFGVGHSAIMPEEVNWRAATLAPVHAILEPSMTGHTEITKSGPMEKLEGSGEIIVDYHRVAPPDVMIVTSNSGNNGASIEVAEASHKRNVKVIAINSVTYSDYLKPLHSSGKKLKDMADVVVDNCCPIGDGVLDFPGMEQSVGPSSTIAGLYILNALMVQTVDNLLARGVEPDVYYNGSLSANSQIVTEHNERLIKKYFYRIRNL
ncbi:MAG: SIS domain-containing protein [Firmicutes bacterium]|nr:SIS domain-containing protein [Bacillota bacterium]